MTTKIEWCDATVNPVVGCSHCSPGCDNCYAERFAVRLAKHPNPEIAARYAGTVDAQGRWTGKINLVSNIEENFCNWVYAAIPQRKPARIFVGSMTDLFYDERPEESGWLEILMNIFTVYPQHTFMLLSKRPEHMRRFFEHYYAYYRRQENLWLGVTVCNQAEADEKIPLLLQTPAAKRFVSVEPMLGPVEIGKYLYGSYECGLSCGTRLPCTALPELQCSKCGFVGPDNYETWGDGPSPECPKCGQDGGCGEIEEICPDCGHYMVREHPDTQYIDWVICGGETGSGARPMHPDWVRSLRDQCQSAAVPFFFKSWGEWTTDYTYDDAISTTGAYVQDTPFARVGKRRAGRLLDGVEHNEFPEGGRAYAN